MKSIIFDIDNTLINWCDDFLNPLRNNLKDFGYYDENLVINVNKSLNNHRFYFERLTKQNLLDFINKSNNINLPMEFIDRFIEEQKKLFYKDEDVNQTLEYLYKKYDLYIMTDWFKETQVGRLKNMGILKYFKEVYGADNNYYKNSLKAYDVMLNKYNSKDCLFIGDNLDLDIKKPKEVGMNTIWKTNKISNEYQTINNIKELMNIL